MDVSRRKGVFEPGGGHNGGMYWDWNSGYIFFKLEGSSPAGGPDPTGESRFQYHVGLFGGYDTKTINNLRTVSLPLSGGGLQLGVGQTAGVVIQADVLKVFEGSARISLAANPTVMVSTYLVHHRFELCRYVSRHPSIHSVAMNRWAFVSLLLSAGIFGLVAACQQTKGVESIKPDPSPVVEYQTTPYPWSKPANFPDPVYDLSKNPLTYEGVALGKTLFFDGMLSHDGTITCAFCHIPETGFAHTDHVLSHGIRDQ